MTGTTWLRAAEVRDLDALTSALDEAFDDTRARLLEGDQVTWLVQAADLLGHRGVVQAAYVGGLVGLVRAGAFEGVRPGWVVNVVAVSSEDLENLTDDDFEALRPPNAATGQVLVTGASLVGRVVV